MNFKNKYLVITIRILFGLFMIFSGVSGLLAGVDAKGIPEPMVPIIKSFWDTGIFQMIKITEVVAGFMLVINFLPALAAIFLAPIAIGIIVFNAMISPSYLAPGIVVSLLDIYLGYVYWDKYKALFKK